MEIHTIENKYQGDQNEKTEYNAYIDLAVCIETVAVAISSSKQGCEIC